MGTPHFIVCGRQTHRFWACGTPASSGSIRARFSAASAHVVSLLHFGRSCDVSTFFIITVFVTKTCEPWLRFTETSGGD